MDYYSKIAEGYDQLYGEEQLVKLRLVSGRIGDKGVVLDIGSGTGLSRKFFKKIIQLDPSIGLLKRSDGMRVCGIAESLPFKDHVFDCIISVTSLHHTKIEKAFEEIRRVSKKKTSYGFSILKRSKNFKKIVLTLKKLKLKNEELEKDLILFKHVE